MYVVSGDLLGLFLVGLCLMPPTDRSADDDTGWVVMGRKLKRKVDWVGAGLASASLTLLAYVLVQNY